MFENSVVFECSWIRKNSAPIARNSCESRYTNSKRALGNREEVVMLNLIPEELMATACHLACYCFTIVTAFVTYFLAPRF